MKRFLDFIGRFRNKMLTKLIVPVICFLLIPTLFFSFLIFRQYEGAVLSQSKELIDNKRQNINDNLLRVFYEMALASNVITMDPDFIALVSSTPGTEAEKYSRAIAVQNKMSSSGATNLKFNTTIVYISSDEEFYTLSSIYKDNDSIRELLSTPWCQDALAAGGQYVWSVAHKDYTRTFFTQPQTLISVVKSVRQYGKSKPGVLIVSIPVPEMMRQVETGLDNASDGYALMDGEGKTVFSTSLFGSLQLLNEDRVVLPAYSDTAFPKITIGDNSYYLSEGAFSYGDMRLQSVYLARTNPKYSEFLNMSYLFYFIFTLLVVITLTFLILFLNRAIKPITALARHMSNVKNRKFDIIPVSRQSDEVYKLTEAYNFMMNDITVLLKKVETQERLKKEADLRALQAQINPHFLFNTLNSIKWSCYMNQDQKSGDLLAMLGRLYELSMGRSSEYFTISEEIEFLRDYIQLASFRYNAGIQIEFLADENVKSCYILKFLLQPIVENSIIHGFAQNMNRPDNKITVVMHRVDNEQKSVLKIKVFDNGAGMSKEKIDAVFRKKAAKTGQFSKVGIWNVQERIQLNYGAEYGLTVSRQPVAGICVDFCLPVISDPSEME